jgi:heme-degrading monooxygenase HmoA
MYIQINTARVHQGKEQPFADALDDEKLRAAFRSTAGFRGVYLLQSKEDPQEFASLSMWDSAADGQAFFTSQEYFAIVGGVREYLKTELVRKGYEVRSENLPGE